MMISNQTELAPENFLSLVKRVAYQVAKKAPSEVDVNDLIGAGTIGLIDAIEKYDEKKCDRFEAYAEIRIRGAILDELRTLDWVPRSIRKKTHQLDDSLSQFVQKNNRMPSQDELAKEMKMSMSDLHLLLEETQPISVISVEDYSFISIEENTLLQQIMKIDAANPLEHLCYEALRDALAEAIDDLAEKERLIVTLYYHEGLKLKEIGKLLKVTESRICQIHSQAISKLKEKIEYFFKKDELN